MTEFFDALRLHVPSDARVLFCQFRGDPNSDAPEKWRARVLNNPDALDDKANIYLCVSAMQRNQRGEFRRRKENFAGGLCLMIDDLGDGPGAKNPLSVIDALPPTALVETSPRNFQAIYMFDGLETDQEKFDALIRAFIESDYLSGADPGMAGVNRVFRPPFGANGKPKYGGWKVRLEGLWPERRYAIETIAEAYGMSLVRERRVRRDAAILGAEKGERIRAFIEARRMLRSAGMLKREEANLAGWIDVQCPWMAGHTGQANNGASIREPEEENEYHGAFRCHHGHCAGRGWRDLTEWLSEEAADILDMINWQAEAMDD